MARFVPLSSTKTSRVGSRWAVAAHHAARSSALRSLAWRTFFDRDPEAADGPGHSCHAEVHPVCHLPPRAVLGQRGVGSGGDLGSQRRGLVGADARAPTGARQRRGQPGGAPASAPADNRAGADVEEPGGLGQGEPSIDRSQQPFAEVGRVVLHPRIVHRGNLFATRSIDHRVLQNYRVPQLMQDRERVCHQCHAESATSPRVRD
jgi:hypothetical protein